MKTDLTTCEAFGQLDGEVADSTSQGPTSHTSECSHMALWLEFYSCL
jgi:hypothetical protein